MKRLFYLLVLPAIFAGCNNKDNFSVSGIIKDDTKKVIYINRVEVDTPVLIDSAKIRKNGEFSLKIKSSEADFYQLGFSNADFITLLAEPGEKIRLDFEGKSLFEKYSVSGSEGTEKLRLLDITLAETEKKLDSLSTLYSKASEEPGFETIGPALEEEYTNVIKEQRKKNIEFIITNTTSLASIKALYQKFYQESDVLYDQKDLQYFKIVTDSLTRYHPDSKHVQALARDFNKEMDVMYSKRLQLMTKDLPETKLDPDLLDVNGKRVALSSLRGKYVLLTFWASRSAESVQENLQLKEYYKLYNKKGFEIYQISLDENESDWKSAVRFDELPWISTREDDPLDPKNAILFNVKILPANYLFDKEGKIIATNIHGKALAIKLEQLFNR